MKSLFTAILAIGCFLLGYFISIEQNGHDYYPQSQQDLHDLKLIKQRMEQGEIEKSKQMLKSLAEIRELYTAYTHY